MATNTTKDNRDSGRPAVPGRQLGALVLLLSLALVAPARAAEKLSICYIATHSALVPLAKQWGFYAAEGLDVEVRSLPSGRHTLAGMFAGDCTLATASENPVVHSSLSRSDFQIIATISVSNNLERIIVRSDRGILTAADLRGRRVAVPQFTVAHYFLDTYLAANGVAPQSVTKVYLPPQEVVQAFRRGEVDAVAHWEPNIQVLAKEFGSNAKVFAAPGLHINPMLLIGGREYLRKNPAIVDSVLRALLRAEGSAKAQPETAKALMARNFDISSSEIDIVWPWHDFRVALDQSLPFLLENAARWEIGLLAPEQRPALPNYLDFISTRGLLAVKPGAVTIIH